MKVVLALLLLVSMAGCFDIEPDEPEAESKVPSQRSIFTEEVDGYGTCTFLWFTTGSGGGGLALVGCDGEAAT